MYRVFRLINRFNIGGPAYNVTYLTKFLSPEFETLLAGGMKDESEAGSEHIPLEYGIKPLIIEKMKRSINPANDVAAYNSIKKVIKQYKPQWLPYHARFLLLFTHITGISSTLILIMYKPPFIKTLRDIWVLKAQP